MGRVFVGAVWVALLFAAVALPGAAQDLGCADFATQAEAQAYFEAGGGSAAYDFAGLDANHDGRACEEHWGSAPGGTPPSAGAPGAEPQPTEEAPPIDGAPPVEESPGDGAPPVAAPEGGTDAEGTGAAVGTSEGGGEVAVVALPDTGAGRFAPSGGGTPAWPLVAITAVVLGVVGRGVIRLGT